MSDPIQKAVYRFTRANMSDTVDLVYDYILDYVRKNGFAPAIRDICVGVGLKSTSTVHAHLNRLVQSGRIIYSRGKRRAIALPPDVMLALNEQAAERASSFDSLTGGDAQAAVLRKTSANAQAAKLAQTERALRAAAPISARKTREPDYDFPDIEESYGDVERMRMRYIPLIGTVTAGLPILASEQIEYLIPFPANYFSDEQELFMLRVRGDSMIDAAILDGDIVLVRKQSYADYGAIIVALIDDEATVKRLIKVAGKPMLKPENTDYELIPFYGPSCSVLGRVMHVLRTDVR